MWIQLSSCKDVHLLTHLPTSILLEEVHVEMPANKRVEKPSFIASQNTIPPLTPEHFRCKGSHHNPITKHTIDGKQTYFQDCDGSHTHSLPIIDGKQTVYPHLIELLNHVQDVTGRQIRVLTGHRCYIHQSYLSSEMKDLTSAYQLGAAADVCFQSSSTGLKEIIHAIMDWYEQTNLPGSTFNANSDSNRWSNRYVQLSYHETTDIDTKYKGPHISITLKVDPSTGKKITYSYRKVRNNLIIY